jgi:hypothetical protein
MRDKIIFLLKRYFEIPILFFVLLIINFFPNYSIDLLLFVIFGAIGIGAFIISTRTKHKLILRLTGIYIILNFLVFPLLYLSLIKFSKDSFEFDNFVFSSEKSYSITELSDYYSIKKLNKESEVIKLLLFQNSSKLDSTLNFLNNGNVVVLDKYILNKNCVPVQFDRPMYKAILNICDLEGNRIGFIENKEEGCYLTESNQTIKVFLEQRLVVLNDRKVEYNSKASDIVEKNNIWKYRQLLPYTLNIFTTDNMIPKSKMANIIFFFHQTIVATVIISIIIGIIQNYLTKDKDANDNNTVL